MTIKVTFSSIEVTISIAYLSSNALLEPFAGAQVQNRGGEKHKSCDSENGVVHEIENRICVLRKWSAGDKDFVSEEGRQNNEAIDEVATLQTCRLSGQA
jgi:hypothetical protein